VIIRIDPHKLLHAACAIDEHETELARLEVHTNSRQVTDLLAWATESADGLAYLLAQQLVRFPTGQLMVRVYELRSNLMPCDATYVALAEGLSARLSRRPTGSCTRHSLPRRHPRVLTARRDRSDLLISVVVPRDHCACVESEDRAFGAT
jgi:hypothetical protein